MNAWNSIENQLRKWTLRQPSPELKGRIFAREEMEESVRLFNFGDASRWFVPALGCFLLVMSSLSMKFQDSNVLQLAATNMLVSSSSNEDARVMYYSKQEHSDKNSIPYKRLEYSFGKKQGLPGIGSFLISYTNRLIQ